jgi:NAD(P)-dependent dehydrogenase (short-subunit alcohol dehydrogenase family)
VIPLAAGAQPAHTASLSGKARRERRHTLRFRHDASKSVFQGAVARTEVRIDCAPADLTRPGNGSRIAFNAAGSPTPWIRVRRVVAVTAASCPFLDVTERQWARRLAVNRTGAFNTAQAVARRLVQNGVRGRPVLVTSWVHARSQDPLSTHSVSKAGPSVLVAGRATELPLTASSWTPSPHGSPMPALRGNGWRVTATPHHHRTASPRGVPDRSGSGRGRRVSPWPREGPHDVWNMLADGGLSVVSLLGRRCQLRPLARRQFPLLDLQEEE